MWEQEHDSTFRIQGVHFLICFLFLPWSPQESPGGSWNLELLCIICLV